MTYIPVVKTEGIEEEEDIAGNVKKADMILRMIRMTIPYIKTKRTTCCNDSSDSEYQTSVPHLENNCYLLSYAKLNGV